MKEQQCIKKSDIKEYRFDVYQFGNKIDELRFDNYEDAQRYWLKNYYNYDYAHILYLDGVRMSFLETYTIFDTARKHQQSWSKPFMI